MRGRHMAEMWGGRSPASAWPSRGFRETKAPGLAAGRLAWNRLHERETACSSSKHSHASTTLVAPSSATRRRPDARVPSIDAQNSGYTGNARPFGHGRSALAKVPSTTAPMLRDIRPDHIMLVHDVS